MSQNFKSLSLSYKTAPVDIRSEVSLDEELSKGLLHLMKSYSDLTDAFVLSTCNRTEIYYNAPQDYTAQILKDLAFVKSNRNIKSYGSYFQKIEDSHQAAIHLFRVAVGLESQVVGDMQITNQVKQAYQWAADLNTPSAYLHRLLHTIFFTNKKVVQETAFRSGAASSSYATVELVEDLVSTHQNPKVLLLGVGEIGRDVFLNLLNSPIEEIAVANRTISKAQDLVKDSRAKVVSFENVWEEIDAADVVISSIARSEPFITAENLKIIQSKTFSYQYFIDLSIPRSIHPNVEQVNGTLLYSIDDIQNKATEALQKRLASIPDVEAIIHQHVSDFENWSQEMEVSPTIKKLKTALEQIRLEEIDRFMKDLSQDESKKVERITKSMMQKIIKLPVLQLKAACKRGEAETLIDVLNDLFNLEQQAEIVSKD